MDLIIQIIKTVLPVMVMILLGCLCNKKKIITTDGLTGLKGVIGNITLPVVLFNAFFTAEYSLKLLLVFVVVYTSCGLALFLGFLMRKWVKPYGKFFPFLMTSFEGGMLGYPLFGLLLGSSALSTFAIVDIGQTMFAYTVFLITLKVVNGEKATPKSIVHNMVKSPACMGVMLGVFLGLLGVNKMIVNTSFGEILAEVISFISGPTAAIILLVLGYELSVKKSILKPVMKTVVLRLAMMAGILCVASLIIFAIIPFDKTLFTALLLMFSLPAPFIVPLFAHVEEHGEYISTTLSVGTIVTIVLYIGITIYTMA